MKFLCDNCKAKYQIGDEKVAGRTVRMKCRRCGHLITVSASVTESSVARKLGADPDRPRSRPPPAAPSEAATVAIPPNPSPRVPAAAPLVARAATQVGIGT